MLFIFYKSPNETQSVKAPPLMIPLTEHDLNKSWNSFMETIHRHFTDFMSPFIHCEHLSLKCGASEQINLEHPIFMYLNNEVYLQEIHCVKLANQRQIKLRQYKIKSVKNEKIKITQNIVSKNEIDILNSYIQKHDKVIINAKLITLNCKLSWGEWLLKYWSDFEYKNNSCIYIFICKQAVQ